MNSTENGRIETDAEATLNEAISALEVAYQCLNNSQSYQVDDPRLADLLETFARIVSELKNTLQNWD